MSEQRWAAVDHYITELFVETDPAVDAAITAGRAAGLPQHDVSPTEGKLLYLLARIQGARSILGSERSPATARSGWPARFRRADGW
jgi:predicted O-methyltransferase YrrM